MKTAKIDSIPDERTKARLEFTCEQTGPEEFTVNYEMVLPLEEADCRGTFDHKASKQRPKNFRMRQLTPDNCFRFQLGGTKVGTSNQQYPFSNLYPDGINLPFRDGAHAGWDRAKLGLEIYYRTPTAIYHLTPEPLRA